MLNAAHARPLMLAAGLFLIGCGSGGAGGTAGTGGSSGTAGTGGSAGGGPAGTTGGAGTAGTLAPITITVPTFSVAAGAETTQCVIVDLGNAKTIHVGEIKTMFGPAVYEILIGATPGPALTKPSTCNPFSAINNRDFRPLVLTRVSNRPTDLLTFPAGVGYTLAAHQFVRIEVHAFNDSAGAADVAVSAAFTPMPDAAFQQEAGLIMFEENSISLAAQATTTVGPTFYPLPTAIGGATVAQLMGYTHKLGAAMKIATATSATDAAPSVIYEPSYNPADPVAVWYTPPLVLPSSGGINLTCTFNNSGATEVVQSFDLTGERCAVVLYYYPATAVQHCLHFIEGGGGTDCCPGSQACPWG